jgi:hypothetical protein
MRPPPRAMETREACVDPPTAIPDGPVAQAESRCGRPVKGQMLRRSPEDRSHRLERRSPFRTPGKIDKPLWVAPTFGGPTETKKARSVVASSRVPRLAGCAGSPPAVSFSEGG